MPADETSYDPALPGKIRKELGVDGPAGGAPVPRRTRSRLLLPGAVAAAALAAAALSGGWRLPGGTPRVRGECLAEARTRLAERDWAGAVRALEALRSAGTLGEEGRMLDDAARGMQRLGAASGRKEWVEAYEAALDLDRTWKEEGALKTEISRLLDGARAEVMAGRSLSEGRDLLEAGRPAEALAALQGVPAGTASAEEAREEARKARASLRGRALDEAEREASQGRWAEAERALASAEAGEDPRAAGLAERIGKGRRAAEAVARAEALLGALRVGEAAQALQDLGPDGPCGAEAEALRRRIEQARACASKVDEARGHFDAGRGEEALRALSGTEGVGAAADLGQGIARTLSAYQGVLDALDRGDDLGALEGVRRICSMPLAQGNWYRARAESARKDMERKVAMAAEKDVAAGVASFRERRWRLSREAFDRAARAVPAHPVAEVYRKRFLEVGRDLFRDGYVLKALDPAAARARFEEALACLPDGDPTALKARQALE